MRGRVLCVSERDEILKGISQCVVPADRGAAGRDTTVASPVTLAAVAGNLQGMCKPVPAACGQRGHGRGPRAAGVGER